MNKFFRKKLYIMYPYYIAIRLANHSYEIMESLHGGEPGYMPPLLLDRYNDYHKAHALIKQGNTDLVMPYLSLTFPLAVAHGKLEKASVMSKQALLDTGGIYEDAVWGALFIHGGWQDCFIDKDPKTAKYHFELRPLVDEYKDYLKGLKTGQCHPSEFQYHGYKLKV